MEGLLRNIEIEEALLSKLKKKLSRKSHFLMIRNLLSYFKLNLSKIREDWTKTLVDFTSKFLTPVKNQFGRASGFPSGLKQAQKAYVKLMEYKKNIFSTKKSYHITCKSFEENYIAQKIYQDIETFYTPKKGKMIGIRQSIKKSHEKLTHAKAKYEEALELYNKSAIQIMNRNVSRMRL